MTGPATPNRDHPSPQLPDFIAEDHRTGPAESAAPTDPPPGADGDPNPVLDTVLTALMAGEPRRADRLLDRLDPIDSDAQPDIARVSAAFRRWAWALGENWYPDFIGAELRPNAGQRAPDDVIPSAGAPIVSYLEHVVASGLILALSARSMIDQEAQRPSPALEEFTHHFVDTFRRFGVSAAALGSSAAHSWSTLAAIDLLRRSMPDDTDWQPEINDLLRAVIAWWHDDHNGHARHVEQAIGHFEQGGHRASSWLAITHRLLHQIAVGDGATVRAESGTDLTGQARGVIAELKAWAETDGSTSYMSGLGRVLYRAAEAWRADGHSDRATAAASLDPPLITRLGPTLTAELLTFQAMLDLDRSLIGRAMVRLEQALQTVPALDHIGSEGPAWLTGGNIFMTMSLAHLRRTASTAAPRSLTTLDRTIEALGNHLEAVDLPTGDATDRLLVEGPAVLDSIAARRGERDLDQMQAESHAAQTDIERDLLQLAAQHLREQLTLLRVHAAQTRASLARAAGSTTESELWFASALKWSDGQHVQPWLGALVCCEQGQFDDAQRRLASPQVRAALPDDLLPSVLVRCRDFETADALYRNPPGPTARNHELTWTELVDRAEAYLETGALQEAQSASTAAISKFESQLDRLTLDTERLGATDDPATADYLLASRIELAVATTGHDGSDEDERRQRAFEWSERGRSHALHRLMTNPTDNDLVRRGHDAATRRAVAVDRLLANHDRGDGDEIALGTQRLASIEHELAAVEAEFSRDRTTSSSQAPATPPNAAAIRRALPDGAALLQYQVLGRRLVAHAVTREHIESFDHWIPDRPLERLVHSVVTGCRDSDPDDNDLDELATILLGPLTRTAHDNRRLIIIPAGPLHQLPFHVLPFDGRPLGSTHVLSYLPTASLLTERPVDQPLTSRDGLVAGDPAFSTTDHPELERLPAAELEANLVSRLLPSAELLTAEHATERNVRVSLNRSILHFAAHGRLDETAPGTSSILLNGTDELTVADLIGQRINAQLAVLSACDTGRGAVTLGGDVIGLGRSLLAAGVQRIIVSLWPVDDTTACVTMETFHRLLKARPPALALSEAEQAVRALDASKLDAAFEALGGELGTPTRRRGTPSPMAARSREIIRSAPGSRGTDQRIAIPEEFADTETHQPQRTGGKAARSWHRSSSSAPEVSMSC